MAPAHRQDIGSPWQDNVCCHATKTARGNVTKCFRSWTGLRVPQVTIWLEALSCWGRPLPSGTVVAWVFCFCFVFFKWVPHKCKDPRFSSRTLQRFSLWLPEVLRLGLQKSHMALIVQHVNQTNEPNLHFIDLYDIERTLNCPNINLDESAGRKGLTTSLTYRVPTVHVFCIWCWGSSLVGMQNVKAYLFHEPSWNKQITRQVFRCLFVHNRC